MNSSLTLQHALLQAHQQGLARIDAQMLLLHVLDQPGASRAWLLTHDQDPLSHDQQAQFAQLCAQRLDGVPVAYLTGCKEFFGLPLQVDARVLDPRPDTETLVEWVLDVVEKIVSPRVADLGTGSGAIALAVQSQRPDAAVTAVDFSPQALDVARANAQRLQLPVQFVASSWLEQVEGVFDVIASNPPYIREDDPHMPALRHEPRHALTSGADGLQDLRAIVAQAPAHLPPGGWLLLEHGWDQAADVQALLRSAGFVQVHSRQDLAGVDRCTGGQIPDGANVGETVK
ncbi:peptide chain release factor N(5)-glutamine methyltransferase [Comamonas aquatica]|uniref:peptide chain release factor N(5)-glutamine methyltransferase n=1 Tax=Comamonas aquatica TaxID=225991 RepID=UPI002447021B|nr:peptide chain release factor N(5)-glutamine methyltransferase [Comamonas aquatica]MDH1673409.1 peptide chain release factor N(5)-glutamine methyltransferase [Comamonas aquatica]MDH1676676.1 peptide chain release factor N(5)-glutamine methyltransferase [Comamonas aquatica]MDH1764629.1 peptide chain release factor N(5)-glutamine methyltransferase [Comamonas aquatica]